MTDTPPVDSLIVAYVAQRCLDVVTNVDTQEQLETLVTERLSSYNNTRGQGWPELTSEMLEDIKLAVVNVLKAYVRGKLPRDLDNIMRRSVESYDGDFETPEGNEITEIFTEMEVPEEVPVDRDNIIPMTDVNGLEVTYEALDFPNSEPETGGNTPAPTAPSY